MHVMLSINQPKH